MSCNTTFSNEFDHSPGANLDYGFDWSSYLETGQTISSSTWSATTGIILTNPQVTGNITSVLAVGGVLNSIYYLTNTIITANPVTTDSRVIVLSCKLI
jgi:hypothetical protein